MATRNTTKPATRKKKATKLDTYVKDTIISLTLLAVAIILFIGMISPAMGIAGTFIKSSLFGLFGIGAFFIPPFIIYISIAIILIKDKFPSRFIAGTLFILLFSAFYNICRFTIPLRAEDMVFSDYFNNLTLNLFEQGHKSLSSGGVFGGYIAVFLETLLGKLGAGIILLFIMIVSFVFTTGISFKKLFEKNDKVLAEDIPIRGNKKIAKEINSLRSEVDTLKKQQDRHKNFKIPETEDTKSDRMIDMLDKIQSPYLKDEKKKNTWMPSFIKKEQATESKENTPEISFQENKEDDIDDLLIPIVPRKSTPSIAKPSTVDDDPIRDVILNKVDKALKEYEPSDLLDEINKTGKSVENNVEKTDLSQKTEEHIYITPPVELLNYVPPVDDESAYEELRNNATKLIDALKSFNVETKVIDVSRGPTITRYELQPNAGVKISKITNLSDDIALHLAALGVRIEAPIPGKAAIGIEIPNKVTSIVYLEELIRGDEFKNSKSPISVCLGKDISGNNIIADLAKMPHLLIAGATGSGKSVCINSLLISLLYKSSPKDVRLVLIDPKVVELNVYNGIPHLLIPVVTDPKKAAGALSWAVSEMLKRYDLFKGKGVRDFGGYNKCITEDEQKLPQIVIVIDEVADLMMTSPTEVEDAICRLAQMARAAGMHLVIATQRPSVDVITGTIKANVPSRIAFAVSSQIDSRIIIDGSGAEKLVGKGDMLFDPMGAAKPLRVQGCYVSDKEVEDVVAFVKENYVSDYDSEIMEKIEANAKEQTKGGKNSSSSSDSDGDDVMLLDAIEVVVEGGQASTSVLQRRLRLGYARAARIMDEMESRGIIGPYQGSKPRTVLMSKQQFYEMKNRSE